MIIKAYNAITSSTRDIVNIEKDNNTLIFKLRFSGMTTDTLSALLPDSELVVNVDTLLKNKRYIIIGHESIEGFYSNIDDMDFTKMYNETANYLPKIVLWVTDNDELFIYAKQSILSDTIIFKNINVNDLANFKNMSSVLGTDSLDPLAQSKFDAEYILYKKKIIIYNKLKSCSFNNCVDIQLDFILNFIKFVLDNNTLLNEKFKQTEFSDIFDMLIGSDIFKIKPLQDCEKDLDFKKEMREAQRLFYEETHNE